MIRECLHEETGTTPFECHSFLKEVLARGLCDKLGHWEESADTKTSKLYIMVSTTVVFFCASQTYQGVFGASNHVQNSGGDLCFRRNPEWRWNLMDSIIVLASLVEIIFEVSSYASGAEEMSLTGMSGAGFPGFKHPPSHSTFRRQWIITGILPPSLSKIWIMADMAVASKCNNCLGLLESTPQNTNLEHYCLILFDFVRYFLFLVSRQALPIFAHHHR